MRVRTRLLTSAAVVGSLVVPLVPGALAGAAPAPRSTPAIDAALAWLETQQQPDGGFEVGGFPGFETPDAVLAIAAAGQTTDEWSEAEALAAVEAVQTEVEAGAVPQDPLDALDDWVDSVQGGSAEVGPKGQQAAKVIALITVPLGLDETDFDPSGDTAGAVDLRAALAASAGDGSYPGLTSTGKAYALWALAALGETPPASLFSAIAAGQQANGGFNFAGDPTGTGFDPDITAVVVSALATAGRTTTDATLQKAVIGLGLQQRWDGEWAGEFDDGNPNSTAMVATAAVTLGSHPDDPCWRNAADTRLAGLAYPSPTEALVARQDESGRVTSPSDGFGVNTFGTSQAIQGLAAAEGHWPYEASQECAAIEPVGNRRTVHALYIDLLVRLADPAGATYWTEQFDAGMSPALLAQRFTGSPEYGGRVVERLYRQYLGREATAAEREQGAGTITAGRRLDLIAALLASDEYYDNSAPTFPSGPPTDESWAEALYQSITGRPAGPGDVDFILDQLDAGRTRLQITRSILGTVEGRGVLVREIYRQLLRRDPSAADRAYWGDLLRRGASPERLVTLIAGSAEYRAHTQA